MLGTDARSTLDEILTAIIRALPDDVDTDPRTWPDRDRLVVVLNWLMEELDPIAEPTERAWFAGQLTAMATALLLPPDRRFSVDGVIVD